jgi:alpha-1,4-galacturonosyltransferase
LWRLWQVEANEERVRAAKLQEALYRHYASSGVPKGLHCLALKLTVEYSSNARARQDLPSPDLAPRLTDLALHHLVLATDNVLAASVVVASTVHNAADPEKIIFHVITDKKTYAAMHAWFSLNPLSPAIVEVKGVHQFDWLTRDNVPVLQAMETSQDMKRYYHGDHTAGTNISQYSPTILAAYLQARSPKYISILNHLRIYLPEVCLSTLLQVSFRVLCANDAQQVIYFWVSGGSSEM